MKITRGYKTEIKLNNQQMTLCKKHAGAARYAYNWGLKRKQEVYQATGKTIYAEELHKELNVLKTSEVPWMYKVSKCAPQEALRDLDDAFGHFFRKAQLKKQGQFRGKLGYPRLKSKKKGLGSFRLTGSITIYEKAIDLPRLGTLRLKECGYLPLHDVKILSATVREQGGRWYVSVQVEEDTPEPVPSTGSEIGIDLGINRLAQCSDGRIVENHKALRKHLKHLQRLQRRLSRKNKGSKNRAKARQRVAREHARIAHIREDALHKATSLFTRAQLSQEERHARYQEIFSALAEPKTKVKPKRGRVPKVVPIIPPLPAHQVYEIKQKQAKARLRQSRPEDAALHPAVIVLENLHVEGMKRNRKIALAISDVGLGEFKRQMKYKAMWQGETLLWADRWFPSTKTCNGCGWIWEAMTLSDRIFICQNVDCHGVGVSVDRDFNASLNLADLARPEKPKSLRRVPPEG